MGRFDFAAWNGRKRFGRRDSLPPGHNLGGGFAGRILFSEPAVLGFSVPRLAKSILRLGPGAFPCLFSGVLVAIGPGFSPW